MINQNLELINILSTAKRRMRFLVFHKHLVFYILGGILFSSIILLISKFTYLSDAIYYFAVVPIFAGAIIASLKMLWYKLTLHDVACELDTKLNLKERLGTALEIIDSGKTGEMESFQVNDATRIASELNLKEVYPYLLPKSGKFIPVALLFLFAFFFMPRLYQLPLEPTTAELEAMREAADALENLNEQDVFTKSMGEKLKDVMTVLRNRKTDIKRAQKQLAELQSEVKAQRDKFSQPDLPQTMDNINKIIGQSKLFSNSDPDSAAKELEELAAKMKNDQIPPEVKKELQEIFKQLLRQLDGLSAPKELVEQLRSIESQPLSPEMLKRIAQNLSELSKRAQSIEQLEKMLTQIQANQQKIGLAGLNLDRKNGGIAQSDSRPGNESNIDEAQGTTVNVNSDSANNEGMDLTLNGQTSQDDSFSPAYTRERPEEVEQIHTPHQEVYLNAKQAMHEALQKERIPARYRKQVLAYFEAIAP